MIRQLQPANSHRICPPGISAIALGAMLGELKQSARRRTGESPEDYLVRLAAPLVRPPDEFLLVWRETAQTECLWLGGGVWPQLDMDRVTAALSLPVLRSLDGMFIGEEGGLGLAEFLECPRAMVADLGQTALKISWAGRRRSFLRDRKKLPFSRRQVQSIAYKGMQRRALRSWAAGSIRQTLEEAGDGVPDGIFFAIPSMLDEWGRPAGSSYAGMQMDTQLAPDALRLAGLPDTKIWILNDAELAATSAIFDERVIRCGGKALVFTLGTAVGCAIADPLAAALHFAGVSGEVPG